MYSELDIHVEQICDPIMEHFKSYLGVSIEDVEGADHPTSIITLMNDADNREFQITITTKEVGDSG